MPAPQKASRSLTNTTFMISYYKFPATFILFLAAALIPPKHRIAGNWTVFGPSNAPVNEHVELKKDGSYLVYIGDQVGERGFYKLKGSVFSIKNAKPVCGDGYWGKYRIDFYGQDSIHFTLIEDTCSDRRRDIVGVNPGLRRMKE